MVIRSASLSVMLHKFPAKNTLVIKRIADEVIEEDSVEVEEDLSLCLRVHEFDRPTAHQQIHIEYLLETPQVTAIDVLVPRAMTHVEKQVTFLELFNDVFDIDEGALIPSPLRLAEVVLDALFSVFEVSTRIE